jgi:hypothetical protein
VDEPGLRDVILTRMRELEKARVLKLEETLRDERLLRKVMQESEWTLKRKETVNRLMAITRRDSGIQRLHDRG